MAIPSVVQGTVEAEDGKIFELDSPKGSAWLESVGSFRFEPVGENKPYTVRKESGKGGDYWYGYRKMSGRLHKKYIGKSSELSTAKLEEIAGTLNTPPQPRVTDKVTQVTEISNLVTDIVTDKVTNKVTDRVTDTHDADRLTALELQVQALQESLEALRGELRGKSESGNSDELPTVTGSELHIQLGNLRVENATLRQELEEARIQHAKLLELSNSTIATREKKIAELWAKLDRETADREEVETQLSDREAEIAELRSELSDLKQNSATAGQELPEPADLLNQLKARRKKSKTDLADMEAILEILEG